MTNCIFYSIIFTLFLDFTFGAIRYSEVNRTFMSMYRGMFEASTLTIDSGGNPVTPYYNKDLLETYLVNYLQENLSKFNLNYEVKVHYFDRFTNEICYTEMCRDVNVTLKTKINTFFTYEKSQNFSVFERGQL